MASGNHGWDGFCGDAPALNALQNPSIDQDPGKQPFSRNPGAGNLFLPDQLVNLAFLDPQLVCNFPGRHHFWHGTCLHTVVPFVTNFDEWCAKTCVSMSVITKKGQSFCIGPYIPVAKRTT